MPTLALERARPTPLRTGVWAGVILSQVVLAGLLLWALPTAELSDARLIVTGPPIVATSVADRANSLPGHPFAAVAGDSTSAALQHLREGKADAVLIVDPAVADDELRVSAAVGASGQEAIEQAARSVSAGLGRDVQVRAAPIKHPRWVPYLIVDGALSLGFLAALVLTLRRGSFETTFWAGVRRLTIFTGLGAAAATVAAPWISPGTWLLITALSMAGGIVATVLTTALGAWGLAAATLIFVLTAEPLTRLTPLILVPEPWRTVSGWFPQGAGLDLATSQVLFDRFGSARSWGILDAWILLSILTLTLSRVHRPASPLVE